MARTNSDDVEEILGGDYDTGRSLAPFIAAASYIIDDVVACAANFGVTYPPERLAMMEAWLAAHLYTIADPRYTMEKDGKAMGQYQITKYSEGALALDRTGCLSGILNGKSTVKAFWMGKRPSEQIAYRDRD